MNHSTTEPAFRRRMSFVSHENGFPWTDAAGITRDQESALMALKKAHLHRAENRVYTVDTHDAMQVRMQDITNWALSQPNHADVLGEEQLSGVSAGFARDQKLIEERTQIAIASTKEAYRKRIEEADAALTKLRKAESELKSAPANVVMSRSEIPNLAEYALMKTGSGNTSGLLYVDKVEIVTHLSALIAGMLRRDLVEARKRRNSLRMERDNEIKRLESEAKRDEAALETKMQRKKDQIEDELRAPWEFLRGHRQHVDISKVPPVIRESISSLMGLKRVREDRVRIAQRELIAQRTEIELACRETARELAKQNHQRRAVQSREDAEAEVAAVFERWLQKLADLRGARSA